MLLDELGIRVELEREGGNNDDPLDGGNDMLREMWGIQSSS